MTDGIRDISDSQDWQAGLTGCFFLQFISDGFKALHQLCGFLFFFGGGGQGGEGIRKFPSYSYHFLMLNLSFLNEIMELIPICPLLTSGHIEK